MGTGTWAPRLQGLKAPDSQTWGRGEQRPQILRDKTWETGSQVLRFEASVLGAEGLESWTPGSEEDELGTWTPGSEEEGLGAWTPRSEEEGLGTWTPGSEEEGLEVWTLRRVRRGRVCPSPLCAALRASVTSAPVQTATS